MEHAWPGNIRQLRHVLRTAAALADGETIQCEHLPGLHDDSAAAAPRAAASLPPIALAAPVLPAALPAMADSATPPLKLNPIQVNERQVLLQMLEQHRWNVSNVAKALDVSRNTLYRKLHKLHIEISHPE
jgi:transcriptional regulator of acetoin/glycerol metabolism